MTGYQSVGAYSPQAPNVNRLQQPPQQTMGNAYSMDGVKLQQPLESDVFSREVPSQEILLQEPPVKKKRTVLKVLGGLLAIGTTAALVVYAKGDKSNTLVERLKSGWQNIKANGLFSSNKNKIDSVFGDTVLETPELIQKDGKTILRMPEKIQRLTGRSDKIINEASNLCLDNVEKGLTDKLSDVRAVNLVVDNAGQKNLITWRKSSGKINCKVMGKNGKAVDFNSLPANIRSAVEDSIEAIKAKNLSKVDSGVHVKNVLYDSRITDGAIGTYLYQGIGNGGANGTQAVRRIITDRFSSESDVVYAAMKNNKKFAKAVKDANPPKNWLGFMDTPNYNRWKVRSATYTPKIKNWPADAKIIIKNNEIIGVEEAGKMVDQIRYDSLQQQFPKAFKDVLDKKLDSVVRYLP